MVPGKYSSLEKRNFGQSVQNKRLFLCAAAAAATAAAVSIVRSCRHIFITTRSALLMQNW